MATLNAARSEQGSLDAELQRTDADARTRVDEAKAAVASAMSDVAKARASLARVGWEADRYAAKSLGEAVKTGKTCVLDDAAGLYRVAPDGTAALVRALAALPTPDVPVRPPFTDVVALGDGRFALTAIGDGYLLDLGADTMRQYFCYEPGGFPEDEEQRTTAVTYDPVAARLYAQPRTFDAAGALVTRLVRDAEVVA